MATRTLNGTRKREKDAQKDVAAESGVVTLPPGAEPKRLFDVGQRRALKTSQVVLLDPLDGKTDTGLRIGILSVYSNEARAAARAAALQYAATRNASSDDAGDDEDDGADAGEESPVIQSNIVEQTIGVTVYWFHADLTKPQNPDGTWPPEEGYSDVLLIDGERVPCTPKTVRELYTNPETNWIQRGVQEWYLNTQNFFTKSKLES